jgi:hypothetical protein
MFLPVGSFDPEVPVLEFKHGFDPEGLVLEFKHGFDPEGLVLETTVQAWYTCVTAEMA